LGVPRSLLQCRQGSWMGLDKGVVFVTWLPGKFDDPDPSTCKRLVL
jgi:hypothetical protein